MTRGKLVSFVGDDLGVVIDGKKHHLLVAPHPSPLSAHRGFFGTKPYSQANALLQAQGDAPIDWALQP